MRSKAQSVFLDAVLCAKQLRVGSAQRCSTSYVRLPNNYPKLPASGTTRLGETVLQDSWVSVTSGSEDYSFKVG